MNKPLEKFPFAHGPILTAALVFFAQGYCAPAVARDFDSLSLEVGADYYHDSNLYRLGKGESAPRGKRHDTVTTRFANLRFEQTYSKQRLTAGLDLARNRYSVNDNLDHDARSEQAAWDWALGRRWNGRFSYDRIKQLAGFDDYFVDTERNINTYRRVAGGARFKWHPSWSVGLGVDEATNRFSGTTLRAAEFDARTTDVSLGWHPKSGNTLTLSYRDTDGQYPNRPRTAGSIREYRQQEVRLRTSWALTGKLDLSGYIGQTRRTYDLAPERDFDGITGRVALDWQATGKLAFRLVARRELGAEDDLIATFAVTEAVALTPTWEVTDKITVGALYERRRRDTRGNAAPGFDPGEASSRDEDITQRYGLSLRYTPIRALAFTLALRRQEREADVARREYDADSVMLSASFTF